MPCVEPVTTVTTAITAGHHAVALLKGITEKIKASGRSEGLSDFIDVQMAMLDLIQKHHEQIWENVQLRQRIHELESDKARDQDLRFDGEVYWKVEGDKKDGPFCQTCYDRDRRLARLHAGKSEAVKWNCTVCNNFVYRGSASNRPVPQMPTDILPGAWAGS